uniref:Putative Rep protein n=1 Tax=Brevibacterium linens TaxID=1703 RepID=P97024_BRELN|nr:putative Rep protein [Brevibacterium linens]
MSTASTETWGQMWLPLCPWPLTICSRAFYRTSRHNALDVRYIEANPQSLSNLLVVDIDHPDAAHAACGTEKPWQPNAVVENPANGHAHAVWALAEPVTRTEYARRKPLAYAAAVTEGLRRSVDGGKGYSGLITKNPTHEQWEASWLTDHLYNLDELTEHLTVSDFMPPDSWQRTKRKNPVGLGRNCTLFETVRWDVYRVCVPSGSATNTPRPEDRHDLKQRSSICARRVTEFSEALPASEIRATIRSFYKWITTRYTGWLDSRTTSEEKSAAYHRNTGRQGGLKGGIASAKLAARPPASALWRQSAMATRERIPVMG